MEHSKVTWSELKSINTSTGLAYKYLDFESLYHVWIDYHGIEFFTDIIKDSGTDHTDFETNYQPCIDKRIMFQCGKTPDNVQMVTPIKNFAWNSITRVSHDFSDKRTWWKGSSSCTGKSCTDTGDHQSYDLPSDLIVTDLVTDRDIITTSTYAITVKKNGTTVTNYTINPITKTIDFDSANADTDVITADGYEAGGSDYDLEPDSGKFFMIDYVEMQISKGAVFTDSLYFEAILNNSTTGNTDYVAGRTSYMTAKDYISKSNHGGYFPAFGELATETIILPWNFMTGYKIFPTGTKCDPTKSEFNTLRVRLANNSLATSCDIATATFYGYELEF